jgi:hypothetical protein
MTEKLSFYDVVDATPRFVVHGSRVCRLNGEPQETAKRHCRCAARCELE